MAVPVETAQTFIHGTPKVQFQKTPVLASFFGVTVIPWDISPDGKRFLMMKPPTSAGAIPAVATPQPKINIVVNWTEELKRRVPVK